jgi:hypothetical protein
MSEPQPHPDSAGIKSGLPPDLTRLPVADEIAYQPLSGWAVAGFGLGALFAVLVGLATIIALVQGAPMFLPVWSVALAAVGIVLSLIGQKQIQSSEGTRAGAKLARIGIWLSLISGLSYISYYYVTGLALQSQANAFLMERGDSDSGFFPILREGATDPAKLNEAFLLTLPATQRGARPDNDEEMIKRYDVGNLKEGTPGLLSQFKYGKSPGLNGVLPRVFFGKQAKDIEVTSLGVQDWTYEQKSYKVKRNYRIKTPEVEMEVTLLVASTEAESAGRGRKWYVNLSASELVNRQTTPLGDGLLWLRNYARISLQQWLDNLNRGEAFTKIRERDKTDWDKKVGEDAAEKRAMIYRLFESTERMRIESVHIGGKNDDLGRWEHTPEGKVRIHHSFRFGLPKAPGQPVAYYVETLTIHETDRALKIEEFGRHAPQPGWELVQIMFTNITPAIDKKMP